LADLLSHVPALRRLRAEHLASDFRAFARAAWNVVFPGRKLAWSPGYDLLSEVLTAVARHDPRFRRLIWNQPPRTAKSFFFSIAFPVWRWLTDPSHQFVFASYEMDLSIDLSVLRRDLIQSPWFQRLFSDRFQLSGDRNQKAQFANDHRGTMFATSTNARLMGFGFDTCVGDDLTSADMALSDVIRTGANTWFDHTLRQRANDPADASILVISQRVHECDVPGFLIQSEPDTWTHISIPLVAEQPARYVFPLSGNVWERPAGDVLQPKRFTSKVIDELRCRRLVFNGQYQQSPVPLEGNMVKASDLQYYGGTDPRTAEPDEHLPKIFDLKIISVDCASKDYSDSDYTAILTIGIKGRKRYVLDCINAHLDVNAMETAIRAQRERHGPVNAILVEGAASGIAVFQRLRVNVGGVIDISPAGGKVARMAATSPEFQAGDWYFPRHARWTQPLTAQLLAFPRSRNDDMVDALSQAAIWLAQQVPLGDKPYTPYLIGCDERNEADAFEVLFNPAPVPEGHGYAMDEATFDAWFQKLK
jgi:predicted phage terminase large subunit-like protein